MQVNLQLFAENITKKDVKITSLLSNKQSKVAKLITDITHKIHSAEFVVDFGDEIDVLSNNAIGESDLLIVSDFLGNEEVRGTK